MNLKNLRGKQSSFLLLQPSAELEKSSVVIEQLIRPTGLLDPEMEVRPIKGQVEDCIGEIKSNKKRKSDSGHNTN